MSKVVTPELLDDAFDDVINELTVAELLAIPGVVEALREDGSLTSEAISKAEENWADAHDLDVAAIEVIEQVIPNLSREACVKLLADVSIQTFDNEAIEVLREAVEVNVIDGTIMHGDVT